MSRILLCTWAPTAMSGMQMTGAGRRAAPAARAAPEDRDRLLRPVRMAEALGIDYLLVAQRWWGSGQEVEGSTWDALAMTAFYAAHTERIRLVTAVHPGFFLPAPTAKWGATIDRLTGGRWAINVTSGWHLKEFGMFGAPLLEHDERYERSAEFIDIVRGGWDHEEFSYSGRHYAVDGLRVEPRPSGTLEVFQGGMSDAAVRMASERSDWMFVNGAPPEKLAALAARVRAQTARTGRRVRIALYAIPLCRDTDEQAEAELAAMAGAIDPQMVARRRESVSGAQGMWAGADGVAMLDTNEGYATGLVGSPVTILSRMLDLHRLGVDCFHLALWDRQFVEHVLPAVRDLHHDHEGAS